MKRISTAPRHLAAPTRRWWLAVVTDWNLEAHHVRLLTLAGESWDRCAQAREAIAKEGLTVTTRLGEIKAHPAVAIERDSRIAFARLVRELDLDIDAPPSGSRPPSLASIAE